MRAMILFLVFLASLVTGVLLATLAHAQSAPAAIVGAYAADPEHHRLNVTVDMEGRRGGTAAARHRVYEAEAH